MQDRFRINAMMQTTLPTFDHEQQAARQHLRALAVSESLQRNLRQEQGLQLELATTFFSQASRTVTSCVSNVVIEPNAAERSGCWVQVGAGDSMSIRVTVLCRH